MIAKTTRKKITIETVKEELLNSLKEIIETQNKRANSLQISKIFSVY